MESESNTDSEEKKDTLSELKTAEDVAKEKAKGKKPMEAETGKQSTKDSDMISGVEFITQKAKGIVIDEAKVLKTETAVISKQKATVAAKRSRGKKRVNVVKSCYSLRSGLKGMMDVDVASVFKPRRAARKRKGKEKKTDDFQGAETDTEEVCKRIRKGRNDDDDMDKDESGAGAPITRSSNRKRKVKSV